MAGLGTLVGGGAVFAGCVYVQLLVGSRAEEKVKLHNVGQAHTRMVLLNEG